MSSPSNFDYSRYETSGMETVAKEAYRIKDGFGGKGILVPDMVEGIPQFSASIGEKMIDIIMSPAGSRHPLVVSGKLQQGEMTHITWVFIHKGVGQDWWVCLSRTFGERCPFCEYRTKLQADPSIPKETYNLYGSGKYPTGIYKMVHHLNPSRIGWQEPVMIWAVNFSFMETTLQSMAKQPFVTEDIPKGYINFMSPRAGVDGGRHIKFEIKSKGQYFDYDGHQFIVRQQPVPGHILLAAEEMRPLDEMVNIPEYDDMKDALEVGLDNPIGGEPTGVGYDTSFSAGPGLGKAVSNAPVFGTPEDSCPFAEYEGVLGETFGNWEDCQTCHLKVKCEEMYNASHPPTPAPTPAAPRSAAPTPVPKGGGAPKLAPKPLPRPKR